MQANKVSIIIPVYNGANYLQEAIDSALRQTYPVTEVLIVNDGSNDGGETERIAASYGEKIRYYYKENGGTASALNFGIERMRGEWFSWLSHDDVYFADKVANQIEFARQYPQARCIYSRHIYIDASGRKIMRGVYGWEPDPNIPQIRQLFLSNHINGCTILIHRSCFERAGLFALDNKTAQDYQMWLLLAAYFGFYYCPRLVVKSRLHTEMGTARLAGKTKTDTDMAIRNADRRLSIFEIFPDKLSRNARPDLVRKCHLELGDLYIRQRNLADLAEKHYLAASCRYLPLRLFIGQLIYFFRRLYKVVYNALAWQVLRWTGKT